MTALHLAQASHRDKLVPLLAAFAAEQGLTVAQDVRLRALDQMIAGVPQGAIWVIGPLRAPIGYIAVSFGWSLTSGGMEGTLTELFIRPGVRRRGIGTEVFTALLPRLAEAGVTRFHLGGATGALERLARKAGFRADEGYVLMSKTLA